MQRNRLLEPRKIWTEWIQRNQRKQTPNYGHFGQIHHDLDRPQIDPTLPFWDAEQDLCSTDPTQEKSVLDYADYTVHPATWPRSYRSHRSYRSYRSYISYRSSVRDVKVWKQNERTKSETKYSTRLKKRQKDEGQNGRETWRVLGERGSGTHPSGHPLRIPSPLPEQEAAAPVHEIVASQ